MKAWDVTVDGIGYRVEFRNSRQIHVNGAVYNLKDYRVKTGMMQTDYEIPLGFRKALFIVRSLSEPRLVVNHIACATGEEYVPIKTPIWAYIFLALHLPNFLNGAIGGGMCAVGMMITASVSSNRKLNLAVKIIICLAALVGAYAVVYGAAFTLAGLLH